MTLTPGSFVMVPSGRLGLFTSSKDGLALIMCGDDKVYVPVAELLPAAEFDRRARLASSR